ncbi:MAG: thermonuclease family protein [Cyanobium sp. MAG06]|nr:thermonuclease family protein [Cyanobium sp. MAG06]
MSANNHYPKYIQIVIIIIIISVVVEFFPIINRDDLSVNLAETRTNKELSILENKQYNIKNIYSGDTFSIDDNGLETVVKVIGVSAPVYNSSNYPDECYGKDSYKYLYSELNGESIYLELDNNNLYDNNNKLLAFVYNNKSEMINKKLLAGGYGYEDLYKHKKIDYKYKDEFIKLQTFAKVNKYGM